MTPAIAQTMITDFAEMILGFVTAVFNTNPVLLAVIGGFFVLVAISRAVASGRKVPQDPSRLFSANQRAEGFGRAGGRCEMDGFLFMRCKSKAHHGDHHYPWSKGGATSMGNFVAACATHNTSKGAKIPTFFATQRMEARRRKYFPAGINVAVGERFAQR
jgi:hypothetical protein